MQGLGNPPEENLLRSPMRGLRVYDVHMNRYTASEARREFFRLLDSVERGEEVVLERKGIRFRLVLDQRNTGSQGPARILEVDDQDILSGEWTWTAGADGQLQFRARKPKK